MSSSSFFNQPTTVNVIGTNDLGDITVSLDGTVLTIDLGAVTLAKLQNIAQGQLIGRFSTGDGAPELITLGEGLSLVAGVLSCTE